MPEHSQLHTSVETKKFILIIAGPADMRGFF
jgi:hypothetical protein